MRDPTEPSVGVVCCTISLPVSGKIAQYHFSSCEGLIDAIAETRLAPINRRRADLLRAADLGGHGGDVRALVAILVVPLVEATLESTG